MNLLVLTNNPDRASFRQRIGCYKDCLNSADIDTEVAKLPDGFMARRNLFKKAAQFDCVFLHKKRLNVIDAPCLRRHSRKIIYDFDDAVMYYDKKPDRFSRKRQKSFERTVRLADAVIAGNEYLAQHARKFNNKVKVIPTGLDTNKYKLNNPKPEDDKIRLVWIGSKATVMYLAEIAEILEDVGSSFKNVVLQTVADEFISLKNMQVEKCNWSSENETDYLVTSDIGLAPLPDNRFTRGKCGFKILQYQAASLPVVTSPVGVNADYVEDGVCGFHAIDKSEWVLKISNLIEDAELRKRLGRQGRKHAEKFDIKIIACQLADSIKKCIKQQD